MARHYDGLIVRQCQYGLLGSNIAVNSAAVVQIYEWEHIVKMYVASMDNVDCGEQNGYITVCVCRRYMKHFCGVTTSVECHCIRKSDLR